MIHRNPQIIGPVFTAISSIQPGQQHFSSDPARAGIQQNLQQLLYPYARTTHGLDQQISPFLSQKLCRLQKPFVFCPAQLRLDIVQAPAEITGLPFFFPHIQQKAVQHRYMSIDRPGSIASLIEIADPSFSGTTVNLFVLRQIMVQIFKNNPIILNRSLTEPLFLLSSDIVPDHILCQTDVAFVFQLNIISFSTIVFFFRPAGNCRPFILCRKRTDLFFGFQGAENTHRTPENGSCMIYL